MQTDAKLDEIVTFIQGARTMPMSSSALINKAELTTLLEELRGLLPQDLQAADAVLAEREAILEEARYNADRMVADARAEQAKLIADHEITAEARTERLRLLDAAQENAEAIRNGVDAHVDAKLAHLEEAATALVDTARKGREHLATATAYRSPGVGGPDGAGAAPGGGHGDEHHNRSAVHQSFESADHEQQASHQTSDPYPRLEPASVPHDQRFVPDRTAESADYRTEWSQMGARV